ncbi:MAG: tetratricopeptide repeat protein [Rhodoferax sp.]
MQRSPFAAQTRHLLWLALALALCYANALGGAYQWDDYKVIVDNPAVQSWDAWRSGAWQGIRPLLKLSYLLNWLWGAGAPGFHVVNVGLHLANSWLVYQLALLWLQAQSGRAAACVASAEVAPSTLALGTALLFAVHPVHTEAVTYICGRSSALMALFYLAGLWLYARSHAPAPLARKAWWAPLLLLAALAVKETAITLPLALCLWERSCGTPWHTLWQRQWRWWVVALCGVLYVLSSNDFLLHMQRSAALNSLNGNVATQALGLVYLMRQWALPLWLNIDPALTLRQSLGQALPELLGLAATLWLVHWSWHRRPWLGFALAWALLHLLAVYLLLPRLDVANERQLYLAAWPLGLALVIEVALAVPGLVRAALFGALLLVLGGLTVQRNQDYASEISLWEATAAQSPTKARVYANLGYAYQLAGRPDEARRAYQTALALQPDHAKARYNLQRLDAL